MTRNHYPADSPGLLEAIEAAIPDPMAWLGHHPELMAIHAANRELVARLLLLQDLCAAMACAVYDNAVERLSPIPASVRDQVRRQAERIDWELTWAMALPRFDALPAPAALAQGLRLPTHLDATEFTPSTACLFL